MNNLQFCLKKVSLFVFDKYQGDENVRFSLSSTSKGQLQFINYNDVNYPMVSLCTIVHIQTKA